MKQSKSSTKTTRIEITISEESKERLIKMAGGQRRIGQFVEQIIYERQFVERLERLEALNGLR